MDELLFQGIMETHQEQAYQITSQAQRAGWVKDLWRFITSPFRPVWGRFEEPGYRSNGPYTVFQHHKGDISARVTAIRRKYFTHL